MFPSSTKQYKDLLAQHTLSQSQRRSRYGYLCTKTENKNYFCLGTHLSVDQTQPGALKGLTTAKCQVRLHLHGLLSWNPLEFVIASIAPAEFCQHVQYRSTAIAMVPPADVTRSAEITTTRYLSLRPYAGWKNCRKYGIGEMSTNAARMIETASKIKATAVDTDVSSAVAVAPPVNIKGSKIDHQVTVNVDIRRPKFRLSLLRKRKTRKNIRTTTMMVPAIKIIAYLVLCVTSSKSSNPHQHIIFEIVARTHFEMHSDFFQFFLFF